MPALFNASEVFAMAIQMEKNGAAFYRKAARQHSGEKCDFLLKLAAMEDVHRVTFVEMREGLAEVDIATSDLYNEGGLYLSAIAGGHRVEGSPSVADTLTGKESLADILRIAVGLEKEAILFYLGLKDVVPPEFGKEKLDHIIGEEKKHVVILTEQLRQVAGGG
jgi:rubrerythrin